ncbi:MAG: MurR/RpiR family transcriptional regulator, partial [Christensenellaceae bacterium]|nr:MurR/RpiR family transcriptional regulator [Christensenellaceae bacterium]
MFENNSTIINIKVNINNLTKSEKVIADYVIRNSNQIPQMTIQELADATSVSKPTVSRFVKNLGFSSYRNFCNELIINSNTHTSEALIYNDIKDFDSIENICNKVFENNVKAINETLSIIDTKTLDNVFKKICEAKTIHIFAQGRSAIV